MQESKEGTETKTAADLQGALEHLKAFVGHTLEAFQVGTGIRNNAPEPITLDVALRLIWTEMDRVFGTLGTANWSSQYLWARLQTPEADGIAKILTVLKGVPVTAGVSFRAYGPREEGDPTVVYACFKLQGQQPAPPIVDAWVLLKHLWAAGITTRDVVLGTKA